MATVICFKKFFAKYFYAIRTILKMTALLEYLDLCKKKFSNNSCIPHFFATKIKQITICYRILIIALAYQIRMHTIM